MIVYFLGNFYRSNFNYHCFVSIISSVYRSRGVSITKNEEVINLPALMGINNLKPFINQYVINVIKRVKFKTKDGQVKEGYDTTILPIACDVYLKFSGRKCFNEVKISKLREV